MSISVKSLLAKNSGRIRLLEAHDRASKEVIRRTVNQDGESFHGFWISGLTQTTQLGIPDTELISPLKRASLFDFHDYLHSKDNRPLCAAFDADSGGELSDIPTLVSILDIKGVSMIIIEDKAVSEPGKKVNSLKETSGSQAQANPHEFAKTLQAFKLASKGRDILITARIESLTTRISQEDPAKEEASIAAALQDAQERAAIYRDGGADAIMIHSKDTEPDEVLTFLRTFRARDTTTPLVVVPTTYSRTTRTALYDAGANVIIYANHLMRARIKAVAPLTDSFLSKQPELFAQDAELRACLDVQNYGCLLNRLLERSLSGDESREAGEYRTLAESQALENMKTVVRSLVDGQLAGCEGDERIISVKELLKINAHQISVV